MSFLPRFVVLTIHRVNNIEDGNIVRRILGATIGIKLTRLVFLVSKLT